MKRFWKGLLGGKLLSETTTQEMISPQIPENSFKEGSYSCGVWIDREDGGGRVLSLEGCDPGVSFHFSCNQERNLIITLASNFGSDIWKLYEKIKALFL